MLLSNGGAPFLGGPVSSDHGFAFVVVIVHAFAGLRLVLEAIDVIDLGIKSRR